ncbi:Protein tssc1 [Allomyces javanicus]|nr:Protein tssc1 [Allomyces javanicus]
MSDSSPTRDFLVRSAQEDVLRLKYSTWDVVCRTVMAASDMPNVVQIDVSMNVGVSGVAVDRIAAVVHWLMRHAPLPHHTRAVHALSGEEERSLFLIGTLGLASENELHLIEYCEDRPDTVAHVEFRHSHEIHAIASCPNRDAKHVIATSYNVVGERSHRMRSTLWRMDSRVIDNLGGNQGAVNLDLEPIVTLDDKFSKFGIAEVQFDPSGNTTKLVGRDRDHLAIYSLTESLTSAMLGATVALPHPEHDPASSGPTGTSSSLSWNPHAPSQIAVAHDQHVSVIDVRAGSVATTFRTHDVQCRSVDWNPNKPHQLATGGDDCAVRYWDPRHAARPVLDDPGRHTHWVTHVQYNRFHDQLVLSASTDHAVHLTSVSSISSLPLGVMSDASEAEDEAAASSGSPPPLRAKLDDGLLMTYDQHEDSVYGLAWSAANPWVFCSASYDGRVLVNTVPNAIKYKIIL